MSKLLTTALATATVTLPHEGICRNIEAVLRHAAIKASVFSVRQAVRDCLAAGFAHFDDGDRAFPIAHPDKTPSWGYVTARESESLWTAETDYGRRRIAALEYIQAHAAEFYLEGRNLRFGKPTFAH